MQIGRIYLNLDNTWQISGCLGTDAVLSEPILANELADYIGENTEINGTLYKIGLIKVWISGGIWGDAFPPGTRLTVQLEPLERPF